MSETEGRTVTTESLKNLLDSTSSTGHPVTGQIKREGSTFEDAELGRDWDASFDSTKQLIERVQNGIPEVSVSRPEYLYTGYVDCGGDGLLPLEIIKQDDGYISAWISGGMADDVEGVEEFADTYGENLYLSLQAFRDGESESIFDIWKE